jgi:hypothetical protein
VLFYLTAKSGVGAGGPLLRVRTAAARARHCCGHHAPHCALRCWPCAYMRRTALALRHVSSFKGAGGLPGVSIGRLLCHSPVLLAFV